MGWTPPHPMLRGSEFGVNAPEWKLENTIRNEEKPVNKITRVGVDTAKSVFHVHATDRHDAVQWQAKLKRREWIEALVARVPAGAVIAMEACGASHHWARVLQKRGYQVRLISAQFVKPYVKSNKNDQIDAAAICEAVSRPSMRFVSIKSVAQQDLQSIHRIRSEHIKSRTAKVNQIRGLVAEYGIVAPIGINQIRRAVPCWLEDAENGLTESFRISLNTLYEDLVYLDERIKVINERIIRLAADDPVASRLMKLRGVGTLTATALSVALGDGSGFLRGRDFAASIGLVPRQHSTGGRDRLLGISKRGNAYLRTLLIHGARTVLQHAGKHDDGLSRWVMNLAERRHKNIAAVALANKTARIAWALVQGDTDYDQRRVSAT